MNDKTYEEIYEEWSRELNQKGEEFEKFAKNKLEDIIREADDLCDFPIPEELQMRMYMPVPEGERQGGCIASQLESVKDMIKEKISYYENWR